jgi:hypothetical protein
VSRSARSAYAKVAAPRIDDTDLARGRDGDAALIVGKPAAFPEAKFR